MNRFEAISILIVNGTYRARYCVSLRHHCGAPENSTYQRKPFNV